MYPSPAGSSENISKHTADPGTFFESPTHDEALARLHYLVENRRHAGLLVGESGSGKSMLLRVFQHQVQRRDCQTAYVDLVGLEMNEMLWKIAIQLGLNLDADLPRHTIWRMLSDRISENRYQRIATVILLDNVDRATGEIANQVQRLLSIDSSPDSQLTVIFTADVTGVHQVDRRLLSLTDLRIELERWDARVTASYLAAYAKRAGRDDVHFDSTATAQVQALSGGLPRSIKQLAELALIASRDEQSSWIDDQIIAAVHEELSVSIVS